MKKLMLKRLFPLIAALCLLLTACGNTAKKDYDPDATAKALMASTAFSETLESMDKDAVCTLYGLDAATVTSCAAYGSLTAGAEEIMVLTLSGGKDAETALKAMEQRVSDQKAALRNYQPGEVSKLDAAILEQRGSSVLLVVAADADAAQAVLDALDK